MQVLQKKCQNVQIISTDTTNKSPISHGRYTPSAPLGHALAWDWPYIHFQLNLNGEPWEYWPRLKLQLALCFATLGVPFEGIVEPPTKKSFKYLTYNSLSLVAFLVTHSAMKQCRHKDAERKLMSKFIDYACTAISLEGNLIQPKHLLIQFSMELLGHGTCNVCLVLAPNKMVHGMHQLCVLLPGLRPIWAVCLKQTMAGTLGTGMASTIDNPTMQDFMRFLMYLNVNNQGYMELFGYKALHACLNCIAILVESYVIEHVALAKLKPAPLPILKSKHGFSRNTAPALRKAWMAKMKLAKFHNSDITKALTSEILPSGVQALFEHACVVAYFNKLKLYFGSAIRIQLSMDASNHTEDTMVTSVYSPHNDMAAYAPIVVMNKATHNDLDFAELKELAAEAKLTRLAAFTHIKALEQVLLGLGLCMDTFMLPHQVLARPLTSSETRIQDPHTKKWMIYNSHTLCSTLQIPANFEWDRLPLLTICIDQASTGLASAQFLMEKTGMLMLQLPDKFHRAWNDIKLSFKVGS